VTPPQKPPAPHGPPTHRPHPDDVDAVKEGLDQTERGELLSPEESAEYLRKLLSDEASSS